MLSFPAISFQKAIDKMLRMGILADFRGDDGVVPAAGLPLAGPKSPVTRAELGGVYKSSGVGAIASRSPSRSERL